MPDIENKHVQNVQTEADMVHRLFEDAFNAALMPGGDRTATSNISRAQHEMCRLTPEDRLSVAQKVKDGEVLLDGNMKPFVLRYNKTLELSLDCWNP